MYTPQQDKCKSKTFGCVSGSDLRVLSMTNDIYMHNTRCYLTGRFPNQSLKNSIIDK